MEVGLEWVGDWSHRGLEVGFKEGWISESKKLEVGFEGLEFGFEEGRRLVLEFGVEDIG